MNIGGHMGGNRGSNNGTVMSIKTARAIEPEFTTARKVDEDARASMMGLSNKDVSEFSPKKAIATKLTPAESAVAMDELEATGKLDPLYFEAYHAASHDIRKALELKKNFYQPMIAHAQRTGRYVDLVRKNLKDAIAEHIDLSAFKPQKSAQVQETSLSKERYAVAA